MATEVKRRRGTTVEHSTFTGAVAELTVDLTKDTVVVHDGATQGGFPLLREDFSNVPTTAPFTHITLDTAIFDTTYTETGSETQGTLYWNSDEETLSLVTNGESFELGQKTEIHVKNQTGAQINKGEVVYASGTLGNSGRILITKMIANGTIPAKRIMGVTAENIANGADGKIITFGKLKNINTSSFSDGDILYVSDSTAGAFQNTEPSQASGHVSLPIGYVIHAHSNGQIFIRVTPIDENEYQNYDAGLQDISDLTPSDDTIIVGNGTNWVAESGDTARASLGLTIGTHVQAWDAQLDEIAALTPTDGVFIVGNGTSFVSESGNTARTSLGLGTGDTPTFAGLTVDGLVVEDEIRTLQSDVIENHLEIESLQDNKVELGELFPDLDKQALGTGDDVTFNGLTANGATDLNSTLNVQGVLTTQNNVLDDGFSSGWSGSNWRITSGGSAELEDLRVRGALRVYEFIAKQISTIGGSEILSIAQGRISSVNAGGETITVENVTGTAGNAFKANDLWICQVTDINNDLESGGTGSIVKSVRGTVTSVSGNDIVVTIDAGDITQLEQGDLIIAYGNTSDADRQAIMYRNVDRSEDNLIMRLQTGITEFANLQAVGNTRVAFGDLNGYSGLSAETFGFFAGKNAEQHVLVTDTGIFFKNGSTVGAQLSSNIFKIGDDDNFLSFNTLNSNFEIKVDTFDLNTSFIQIADSISKTSSTLTSSVAYSGDLSLDGLFFDEDNYFGYLTDVEAVESNGYAFRVGGNTSNFMELNTANGISKINFDTFTLDATDASGGIKIDSANELIQLEDANRVRTQIDVNNGAPTVSPTSEINDSTTHAFDKDASYTTSSFQVTNGDSIRVKVTAQLIDISSLDSGDNFQFEVRLLSSSTSGGSYSQVGSTVISELFNGLDEFNSDTVSFSYHTYGNEYFKVQVSAQSVDADPADDPQFQTTLIDVDSFPSVTRVSLDGVFVQNNDLQYAQFTRTKNELSGQIFLKNLPDSDPSISGQLYRDSSGNLKVSL